ncbi:MAG: type VI secretion system TssO [Bacteroidota bacterium]
MKPINEKERTLAFVQFLVLFILTVILTVFFVFADFSIKKKDYQVLRDQVAKLQGEKQLLDSLSRQIEAITVKMNTMDKASSTDLDNTQLDIKGQLAGWKSSISTDTTNIERMKISIANALQNWANDKRAVNAQQNQNTNFQELQKAKKDLEEKFIQLQQDYNSYKATCKC